MGRTSPSASGVKRSSGGVIAPKSRPREGCRATDPQRVRIRRVDEDLDAAIGERARAARVVRMAVGAHDARDILETATEA